VGHNPLEEQEKVAQMKCEMNEVQNIRTNSEKEEALRCVIQL